MNTRLTKVKSVQYILEHFKGQLFDPVVNRIDEPWFYFLHIPKTAGTSFRHVLYETFAQGTIYPNFYELNVKQKARYLSWGEFAKNEPQLFTDKKRILIGHFGWAPMNYYKLHPPKLLAFFRDPLERVKSSIVYHQRRGRIYSGLKIDDILDKYMVREGALQARNLGFNKKTDNLNQVLERIDQIDFIGISEEYDHSVALCNKVFKWQLKSGPRFNVGVKARNYFTSYQKERILEGCKIDSIIYDYARKKFRKKCEDYL